jgi:hypothetical protein
MPEKNVTAKPGVSRKQRISQEGLLRLEKQLRSGVNISDQVLAQWVKRYGDDARNLILRYRANNGILADE